MNTKLVVLIKMSMICLLFIPGRSLKGQVNLLVGYGLGFSPSEGINKALDDHNAINDWYKLRFDDVHLTHGLFLGIRYGWPDIKALLHYRNTGIRTKAEGIPPNSNEAFERILFFRNNLIGLGLESNNRLINWGATVDYNFFRISTETNELSDSYRLQRDRFLSSHLYINIDFFGQDYLGLTLQPYVQIPWKKFDLGPLAEELEVSGNTYQHNALTFGVTLILVNGPQ